MEEAVDTLQGSVVDEESSTLARASACFVASARENSQYDLDRDQRSWASRPAGWLIISRRNEGCHRYRSDLPCIETGDLSRLLAESAKIAGRDATWGSDTLLDCWILSTPPARTTVVG